MWEYLYVYQDPDGSVHHNGKTVVTKKERKKRALGHIINHLNLLGKEGWELVGFHPGTYMFKKKIK